MASEHDGRLEQPYRYRALALLAALLLGGVGACAAKKPRALPMPIPAVRYTLSIGHGWITGEVLLPLEATQPTPVVISPLNSDWQLLSQGIGVVRHKTNWSILRALAKPDAPKAGDDAESGEEKAAPAVGKWLLAASRPGIVGRAYFVTLAYEAEKTVPKILDALEQLPRVDGNRIGIAGSSTSGFLALQAMAHDERIGAGFVRAATGDYLCFLRSSDLALADDPRWLRDGKVELDPPYARKIDAIDPLANLAAFPPRPLFLLSGSDDQAIPATCVKNTAAAFEVAYANAAAPEAFTWVELAGVQHSFPETSLDTALGFWKRTFEPAADSAINQSP